MFRSAAKAPFRRRTEADRSHSPLPRRRAPLFPDDGLVTDAPSLTSDPPSHYTALYQLRRPPRNTDAHPGAAPERKRKKKGVGKA